MKNVRLVDVAKRLNITKVSVSKALRDHSDISEETRKKVKKIAKEMGYRPNLVARSLAAKKTNIIGVIVPKIAHPFFSAVIEGIYQSALKSKYEVILGISMEDDELEKKHIGSMLDMRVEGLLVSISEKTKDAKNFDAARDMGVDLVFYDRGFIDGGFSYVKVEDREGARKGVSYMINRGYKKIAYLSGYEEDNECGNRNIAKIGRDRTLGYRDAMAEAGLDIDESAIIETGFNERDGCRGFEKLMQEYGQPEAIFCVTYPVGLGALQYMKDHSIDPDDIPILSFGSSVFNQNLSHPFICIDQPAFLLGQRAFEQLVTEIESEEKTSPKLISLETSILED